MTTFKSKASHPTQAIVVVFDLEGFSKFFGQPDVNDYVTIYLNHILNVMDIIINGGDAYYYEKSKPYTALAKPMHSKFLGDGMLYVWKYDAIKNDTLTLLNRLWDAKLFLNKINEKCADDVPVVDIPQKIRFGIAGGSIYKLTYFNSNKEEYIGYSINLASRLQSYCPELGFIASARIGMQQAKLDKSSYKKVIATKIKGFPREIVIVDKIEYDLLNATIKKDLFEEINNTGK